MKWLFLVVCFVSLLGCVGPSKCLVEANEVRHTNAMTVIDAFMATVHQSNATGPVKLEYARQIIRARNNEINLYAGMRALLKEQEEAHANLEKLLKKIGILEWVNP